MQKFSRTSPALARIKERYPLTGKESTKETWHIALDVSGIDLPYAPGDSIGIYPKNDPTLVQHLIEAMKATGDEPILHKRSGRTLSLKEFLSKEANLARISTHFLRLIHTHACCPEVAHLLEAENREKLKAFLTEKDPLHLLRTYVKNRLPLQELCDQFGPLLPRFFSIASSQLADPTTLDLTVALYTWEQDGEKKYGVASHFLCYLAQIGETEIPFYLQPADHFRLPEDQSTDIIMIGPGTGIAPFRAFIQERLHKKATGKQWLFFGERNRSTDFFYESLWTQIPSLRLSTAFSRDQSQKTYVQHRIEEEGKEVYHWLEQGAHLYVCGDAKEMAKDVEKALISLLTEHGSHSEEEARERLKLLKKSGRYNLDVY